MGITVEEALKSGAEMVTSVTSIIANATESLPARIQAWTDAASLAASFDMQVYKDQNEQYVFLHAGAVVATGTAFEAAFDLALSAALLNPSIPHVKVAVGLASFGAAYYFADEISQSVDDIAAFMSETKKEQNDLKSLLVTGSSGDEMIYELPEGELPIYRFNTSPSAQTAEETIQKVVEGLKRDGGEIQDGTFIEKDDGVNPVDTMLYYSQSDSELQGLLLESGGSIDLAIVQDVPDGQGGSNGVLVDGTGSVSTSSGLVAVTDFFGMVFSRDHKVGDFIAGVGENALAYYSQTDNAGNTYYDTTALMSEITSRLIGGENIVDVVEDIAQRLLVIGGVGEVFDTIKANIDGDNSLLSATNTELVKGALLDFAVATILSDKSPDEAVHQIVTSQVINSSLQSEVFKDLFVADNKLNIGGVAVSAAAMSLITAMTSGDAIGEEQVGYAAIAAGQASVAASVAGTLGDGITTTLWGLLDKQWTVFDPASFAVTVAISVALSQMLKPEIYHDETISHRTEEQPDGSLQITGLRDAGSLLRTVGNTNDDFYGNDSGVGDNLGNDVIVGQSGANEIYGLGGHDFIEGRAAADYIEGGTGDDHIEAGDGDDFADGGAGNDRVYGGDGADNVLGGAGDDTVLGGAGDDQVEGNDGDDLLYGGEGADTMLGGAGNDTLEGGLGADILSGEAGDDEIDGGAGDDEIRGDDGNDVLFGGDGNDDVRGGNDNDYVFGEAGVDQLYGNAGDDTLDGGLESDIAFGGIGNDTIAGGYGDDDLYGEIGEDLIVGGRGNDLVDGGAGNDAFLYTSGDGHDTIQDTDGLNTLKLMDMNDIDVASLQQVGNDLVITFDVDNTVTVQDHFITSGLEYIEFADGQAIRVPDIAYDGGGNGSYVLVAGQNVLNTFAAQNTRYQDISTPFSASTALTTTWLSDNYDLNVTTEAYDRELYNDVQVKFWQKSAGFFGMKKSMGYYDYYERFLRGSGDADRIVGMWWNETLNGDANNDQLYGNVGSDIISGGVDHDLIYGGADADTINGDAGTDKIFGGTGDDTITTGDGNDTAFGEWGADTLYGGLGDDYLSGGQDNDTVSGEGGKDIIYGDTGNDTLYGGEGDDFLSGGDGIDIINGDAGNDLLFGGDGGDTLNAGAGDDVIIGGDGADTIDGGDGIDTAVLSGNIADYTVVSDVDGVVSLTDNRAGGLIGTDTISNVEKLQFADGDIDWSLMFPTQAFSLQITQSQTFNGQVTVPAGHTLALVASPTTGLLILNPDGSYSYTADANYVGVTAFQYSLTSPEGVVKVQQMDIGVHDEASAGDASTEDLVANATSRNNGSDLRERTRVAQLSDGGYVVAWNSYYAAGNTRETLLQRYDIEGNAVGGPQLITTTVSLQGMVNVVGIESGGYAATWSDWGSDGQYWGVYFKLFDSQGNAITGDIKANVQSVGSQYESSVTQLDNGDVLVVWSTTQTNLSVFEIFMRRYSSTGVALGTEKRVEWYNDATTPGTIFDQPSVQSLAGGGYIITWQAYRNGIYGQVFDANDNPTTGKFAIASYDLLYRDNHSQEVAALADGGFVVTWDGREADGTYNIYQRRYGSNGVPNGINGGAAVLVNSYTAGDQTVPTVTTLDDDGFLITWTSYNQDGSQGGIYAKRFDNAGNVIGNEVQINNTVIGDQRHPDVANIGDNRVVISWTSEVTSGSLQIYKKVLGVSNTGLSIVVEGTDVDDVFAGGTNQSIDGFAGFDAVVYNGNIADYTVDISSGGIVSVVDNAGNDEGDLLVNVESLEFADGAVDLTSTFPDQSSSLQIAQGQGYSGQFDVPAGYTISLVSAPLSGVLNLNPDGSYTYTADASYIGGASFEYSLTDLNGVVKTQQMDIGVYGVPGTEATLEELVSTATSRNSIDLRERTRVADLVGGGYAVAWVGNALGRIYVQRYDDDGNKVGGAQTVSTAGIYQGLPNIVGLSNGGYAVTWSDWGSDSQYWGALLKIYDAQGTAVTGNIIVNTTGGGSQYESNLVELPNGEIVVAWSSGQSSFAIYQRRFSSTGTALTSQVLVESYADPATGGTIFDQPALQALANGGYVITWQAYRNGVFAQTFNASGVATSAKLAVASFDLLYRDYHSQDVTALADGGFVVTWDQKVGTSYEIYQRRFDANGIANGINGGAAVLVNTYTSSDQTMPTVTTLDDDGFLVTWTSYNQDGSLGGIYAQRFDNTGAAVGDELQVNDSTSADQRHPDVVNIGNNRVLISWTSEVSSGSLQIFKKVLGISPVGLQLIIEGTAGDDILVGDDQYILDGLAGTDTAAYSGNLADYTVTVDANGVTTVVEDATSATNTLVNVESIAFADTTLDMTTLFPEQFTTMYMSQSQNYAGQFDLPGGYTIAVNEAPSVGTFNLNADGSYTYDADAVYTGVSSFKYSLTTAGGVTRIYQMDVQSNAAGDSTVTGTDDADILVGGTGTDILSGGLGDDTYAFNLGDGSDMIDNQDGAGNDTLDLGTNIDRHDVWFSQSGYDLRADILGTTDSVTFANWFVNDAQKVDTITSDDNFTLDSSDVNQLINAMAGFNPQAIGSVADITDLPDSVQNAITATWTP